MFDPLNIFLPLLPEALVVVTAEVVAADILAAEVVSSDILTAEVVED